MHQNIQKCPICSRVRETGAFLFILRHAAPEEKVSLFLKPANEGVVQTSFKIYRGSGPPLSMTRQKKNDKYTSKAYLSIFPLADQHLSLALLSRLFVSLKKLFF